MKEYELMQSVDHESIVRVFGVVLDANQIMLVTELAPLRSLLECLKVFQSLSNNMKYMWLIGVGKVLIY